MYCGATANCQMVSASTQGTVARVNQAMRITAPTRLHVHRLADTLSMHPRGLPPAISRCHRPYVSTGRHTRSAERVEPNVRTGGLTEVAARRDHTSIALRLRASRLHLIKEALEDGHVDQAT